MTLETEKSGGLHLKNRRNKKINNILYLIISLVIIVGGVYLIMHFIARPYIVKGVSMRPTIEEKDFLIVNRLAYNKNAPQRFDIIVFENNYSQDPYQDYVKRIIGLPGETVQIMNDTIYINTEELEEFYGLESQIEDLGNIGFPYALGTDEYFVLGDNRNESVDSRYTAIGPVKENEITGRVDFRLFPLNSFGSLKDQ